MKLRRDDAVYVHYEPSCVVPDDPGEVVRHARPITDADRAAIHEQYIQQLVAQGRDEPAIAARERRIAIEQDRVGAYVEFKLWRIANSA